MFWYLVERGSGIKGFFHTEIIQSVLCYYYVRYLQQMVADEHWLNHKFHIHLSRVYVLLTNTLTSSNGFYYRLSFL